MHRWRWFVAAVCLCSLAVVAGGAAADDSCQFPVTVTDATGTEVTVDSEPRRIVTLAPSAAQTLWELGARDRVVGVTKHAGYLEGADSKRQLSTKEQLVSVEAVADADPDLVLAPNIVDPETVDSLRDAGLTVYAFPPAETIDDVSAETHRIGRLTGQCGAANRTVSSMEERIGVARDAAAGRERPDVLYLFYGYTAGNGTFIHELIEASGGTNAAADEGVTGYEQVDGEFVLETDPDWIVRNSENPIGIEDTILNRTTAGERNRTVVVQIEHINQPAPRIAVAVTRLSKRFHPAAYAAANATATPTTGTPHPGHSTATATVGSATPDAGGTAATGPGLGILAGLVAAVGASFLARRHA